MFRLTIAYTIMEHDSVPERRECAAMKRKKSRSGNNADTELGAADQLANKLFDYTGVIDFGRSLYPDQVDTTEAMEDYEQQLQAASEKNSKPRKKAGSEEIEAPE